MGSGQLRKAVAFSKDQQADLDDPAALLDTKLFQ